MPESRLDGVVIAFDIDNTLLDPDGTAYRATTTEFLSAVDIGVDGDTLLLSYEELRSRGDVLARLGLTNPRHERNHPEGLAVLCLLYGRSEMVRRTLRVSSSDQAGYRKLVDALAVLHARTVWGPLGARLRAEIALQQDLTARENVKRFQQEARRIAGLSMIEDWSRSYPAIETRQAVYDWAPLLTRLVEQGASVTVISEGRRDVQCGKLHRLGLDELCGGRVLLTEAAAEVPGVGELCEVLSRLIHQQLAAGSDLLDPQLLFLWPYHGLIDSWSRKTSAFFGRCLHAIARAPTTPQLILPEPIFVPLRHWQAHPLRFVMVGDRYDTDVAPLVDLLGCGVGMKIRLGMGKYRDRNKESELPFDRRPDRTFESCDALANFLSEQLSADDVVPISVPPNFAARDTVPPESVERGLTSSYEAVRLVAKALKAMECS